MPPATASDQELPLDLLQHTLERLQSEAVRLILEGPAAIADLCRVAPDILEGNAPWWASAAGVMTAVLAAYLGVRRACRGRKRIATACYPPLVAFLTLAGFELLAIAVASLVGRVLLVRALHIPPGSDGLPTQVTVTVARWLFGLMLAIIVFQPRFPQFRLMPVDDGGALKAVRSFAVLLAVAHGHVLLLGLAAQAGLARSSAEIVSILLSIVLTFAAMGLVGVLRSHGLSLPAQLLANLVILAMLLLWAWGWFASDFSAYRGAVDIFAVLLLALAVDRAVAIATDRSRSLDRMRLLFVFRIALDASAAAVILRILIGVWLFGQSSWLSRPDWPSFAGRLDLAFLVLILGIAVAASIHVWTDATLTRSNRLAGTTQGPSRLDRLSTVLPILRVTLIGLVGVSFALAALAAVGVDVTPFLAGAGLVGIALTFGLQALVKDVAAGIFTSLDDVFRLGEDIESNERRGMLERINMRSIQLRDQNGGLHTIPLGDLGAVTNHSRRLVRMVVAVALDVVPSQADLALFSRRATEVLHSEPAFHSAAVGDVTMDVAEPAEGGSGTIALSFSLIAIKAAGLREQVQRLLEEVIREFALLEIDPVVTVSTKEWVRSSTGA